MRGREEHVWEEDDGHYPHHLHHQRGRHHRKHLCGQADEYQGACRADIECVSHHYDSTESEKF